jgi:hypothetical protein
MTPSQFSLLISIFTDHHRQRGGEVQTITTSFLAATAADYFFASIITIILIAGQLAVPAKKHSYHSDLIKTGHGARTTSTHRTRTKPTPRPLPKEIERKKSARASHKQREQPQHPFLPLSRIYI